MSIFSSIGKFFKKIFSAIKSALQKLFDFLGPLLPILILAVMLFAPTLGVWLSEMGLTTIGGALSSLGVLLEPIGIYGRLALGLGASFLLFPDETAELVTSVASAAGDALSAVGSAVGEVLGSTASSFFSSSNIFVYLLVGLGVYWFITKPSPQTDKTNDS